MRATTLATEALTYAKEAKTNLVHEDGIGSDLSPSVIAWKPTGPTGYAILTTPSHTREAELNNLLNAITTITHGWQADAIAVIKEGYAATRDSTTHDPRPLAQRFIDDPSVNECITICLVLTNGDATFIIQPFKVGLGRKVEWLKPDIVPLQHNDIPIAAVIHEAMTIPAPHNNPLETLDTRLQAAQHLTDLGFVCVWDA